MEKVIAFNPPIKWIREKIKSAGTKIGSVYFIKKSDGKLRKMTYRVGVHSPSFAPIPKGKKFKEVCVNCGIYANKDNVHNDPYCQGPFKKVWDKDRSNDIITVLDTNKVVRNKEGNIKGRGAWRSIPLNNVTRICNNGTEYIIQKY